MVSSTEFIIHSIIDKLVWIKSASTLEECKARAVKSISFYSHTLQKGGLTRHEIQMTADQFKKMMDELKKQGGKDAKGNVGGKSNQLKK